MEQTSETSVQATIESAMQSFQAEERWESIFLFSSEGLLMASVGTSPEYGEEKLLEFSFSLMQAVRSLDRSLPLMEIRLSGRGRRTLVFRLFEGWDEELVLAAVIPGRKGYRRAMNKLIRLIQGLY